MNDAHDDFTRHAEGDGNAEMWNSIEKIYGAIDGIDDPLTVGILISCDALLAVKRVARTGTEQDSGDEVLGLLIECQFDVVIRGFINLHVSAEVQAKEFSRFEGGVGGEFEIGHDGEV